MKYLAFRPTLTDRVMVKRIRRSLPRQSHIGFEEALSSLLKSETHFLTDRTTQGHIFFVASVLCAYRQLLQGGLSEQDAKAKLGSVLRQLGRRHIAIIIWITCVISKDPFETIRRYSRAKAENAYGPTFEIVEADLEDGFVSEVKVCGYRSFLARHNALHLTETLCEWDKVWIEALPRSICFKRPTTLATGGCSCRFEFRRQEGK